MINPNMKTVCDHCSANYIVKHDLPDDYIEQYCPFCGEEHENIEEDVIDMNQLKNYQKIVRHLFI